MDKILTRSHLFSPFCARTHVLTLTDVHIQNIIEDPRYQSRQASARRNVYGAWEQYLGLEHPDNTPKRAFAANQWNFVFLPLGRPEYLLDSDVVSSRSQDEGDSTRSWHLFTSGDMVQECSTAKDPQFSEDSDNGYSYGSSSTDDDCNPAMDVDTDSGEYEEAMEQVAQAILLNPALAISS
ncbi:uncharacterized protein LOC108210850 isoform X5 [Daucus carota subsp. sativus]|uniref:uncharacterized protein LOC108210850 isoform X5 n=1 Tax=Daucus carota subsp. sativus TaxID=79200 RepID=UPI0007F020CB|nr:PREDICTED: uncharacterized protein LOC108210850 isoform X4 [Daucus carota subsp. sativus]XP_017237776.1 PREDICTED: uncharacterized protein LOC108210850 isoform X4 [Daucus carota subsp. sativus]